MTKERGFSISKIKDKVVRAAHDLRWSMRENMPEPELLTQLWPSEKPETHLDPTLTDRELYRHFIYIDGQNEREHKGSLANPFWRHFHQYSVATKGLETGAIDYKVSRDMLYEAMAETNLEKIDHVLLFWLEELKKYEGKFVEVWGDRRVLARSVEQAISQNRRPTDRAYMRAIYLDAFSDGLSQEDKGNLVKSSVGELVARMPSPYHLAEVYSRDDADIVKKRKVSFETNGNDPHWILTFMNIAGRHGFKKEIKPLEDYMNKTLMVYDPALGDPYFTGYLMHYSMNNEHVDKKTRDYFRKRVVASVKAFSPGLHGTDTLFAKLVDVNFDLGYISTALKALRSLTEVTEVTHAAGIFMQKAGDKYPEPNDLYKTIYLPLHLKRWRGNIEELAAGETEDAKDEKRFWMFQWVLTASHVSEEESLRIYARGDVQEFVAGEFFGNQLDLVARSLTPKHMDEPILKILLNKINSAFDSYENGIFERDYDKRNARDNAKEAIQALLTLRSKGLL